jgi:SP family general alpha glucoside:H+ symporter-like MFS transporter
MADSKNDSAVETEVAPQRDSNLLIQDARIATRNEHEMSLLEGIKLYPKAIGWSVLLSTAIIMEGYGKN